jgi:hypothetical protein
MVTDKSAAAFGGQKLSEAKTNKTIYLVDARVLGVGEGGGGGNSEKATTQQQQQQQKRVDLLLAILLLPLE